ncbi:MAG: ATP phosphoribosyltransferase regulatory subunit [Lautropia sp.]
MNRWQLPEAISDLLPAQAQSLESLRRAILDCYRASGYQLVVPPLVEYVDSLLIGRGGDLDLKTFKLVDQLTGRTLGVRADITPQVARIDAHLLQGRQVTRLCYCASVLRTRPNGLEASREPIQIGAELYGHAGVEADIEAIDLLLRSLALAGIGRVRLDLCDMGLARQLLAGLPAGVANDRLEDEVFELLQARDLPALRQLLAAAGDEPAARAILELADCFGPAERVLGRARSAFARWPQALSVLDQLERVIASPRLRQHAGAVEFALDLADVRGFRYHTGLSFSAYAERHARAIGRGGRYDGIGAAFGRSRAATGFSLDLRQLVELREAPAPEGLVVAPWSEDAALTALIDRLRREGNIVLQLLPGQTEPGPDRPVERIIEWVQGRWQVLPAPVPGAPCGRTDDRRLEP